MEYSNKKKRTIDNVQQLGWASMVLCLVEKESISKCYILYDSIYVTLLKGQNFRHGEQGWELGANPKMEHQEVIFW